MHARFRDGRIRLGRWGIRAACANFEPLVYGGLEIVYLPVAKKGDDAGEVLQPPHRSFILWAQPRDKVNE